MKTLAITALMAAAVALAPAGATAQVQPGQGAATAADSLAGLGQLQEAAWAARAAGDPATADRLEDRLHAILREPPVRARPLAMDSQGVSYTFRLRHGEGVESIFKVDGSDIFCRSCGADREVAAYRVDRLLGFDLAPMTVFHRVVQDGDTLRGSAMYFVRDAQHPLDLGIPKSDRLRLFDAIIGNSDRHAGNWLIRDGRIVAIDHNRAFEYRPTTRPKTCWETEIDAILEPERLGEPYRRYRTLPADSLRAAVDGVLEPELADDFVAMRDRVVDRIEQRIRSPLARLPLQDCPWDT